MGTHCVLGRVGDAHSRAKLSLVVIRLALEQRLGVKGALGCRANLGCVRLGSNFGDVGGQADVGGRRLGVRDALQQFTSCQ